ncbi:hypothetical protein C8J56DRAFT_892996 [Mycena floridula]|nr:hypothetical protein C8J56DRAFT_892996 [Mycena floridula]
MTVRLENRMFRNISKVRRLIVVRRLFSQDRTFRDSFTTVTIDGTLKAEILEGGVEGLDPEPLWIESYEEEVAVLIESESRLLSDECNVRARSTSCCCCIKARKSSIDELRRLPISGVGAESKFAAEMELVGAGLEESKAGEWDSTEPVLIQIIAVGSRNTQPDLLDFLSPESIYCIQTVQWACGIPVGWGKCYRSESPSQVLGIINRLWENYPQSRPSFLVYDDACDLLRHIATRNPQDLWITTTRFIVDAWHYIGHQATDILSSRNGMITAESTQLRAFNTETAEQFNAWLDHFGAQLKQMTARNYDVFIHALFLVYKEMREKEISAKGQELTQEFWDIVDSTKEPNYT